MADEWIKMRIRLQNAGKVQVMASFLSDSPAFVKWITRDCPDLSRATITSAFQFVARDIVNAIVVCGLLRVWGEAAERGKALPENDDVLLERVDLPAIDGVAQTPDFGAAMAKVEWVIAVENGVVFPNFNDFNKIASHRKDPGNSERQAALRAKKKAAESCRALSRATVAPEKGRGENLSHSSKSDRSTDRGDRSPMKNRAGLLDTSDVDWGQVVARVMKVAKLVPPITAADRRAWIRYAVLSCLGDLSEHWLIDAAQGVAAAPRSEGKPQGHFVAILKAKAAEKGIDAETLLGMAKRIEIPDDIWAADILPVKARTK